MRNLCNRFEKAPAISAARDVERFSNIAGLVARAGAVQSLKSLNDTHKRGPAIQATLPEDQVESFSISQI